MIERMKNIKNNTLRLAGDSVEDAGCTAKSYPKIPVKEPLSLVSVLHHKEAFDRPHDIELKGDFAFIPGKGGSLAIVNIKSLDKPRLIWWKREAVKLQDAETVLPVGDRLYLGTRDFFSIDVSNPEVPVFDCQISDRPRIDTINGMVRRDNFIFSANKTGWISVFDISSPVNVVYIGSFDARGNSEIYSPHDIDEWDDFIATVDQSTNSPLKFRIYRIADAKTHLLLPIDKWEVAGGIRSDDLNGANRLAVSGGYAFIACSKSANYGFSIGFIDVQDPFRPVHLKTLQFAGSSPTGLCISGKILFVAGGRTVQVLNVSNPAEPETLAVFYSEKLFPTGRDNAHDLVYRNGYLYVTAQNDNQIGIIKVNDEQIISLANESL